MSNHPLDTELLALVDGELDAARASRIESHLQACHECRSTRARLAETTSDVAMLWHGDAPRMPDADQTRERLQHAIVADIAQRSSRRAISLFAITAALVFLMLRHEAANIERVLQAKTHEWRALPVALYTPGASQAGVTAVTLCDSRPVPVPVVPESVRRQVLEAYGMEDVPAEEYQLDYLITPELGGLPDRRNLWPELYGSPSWNAHAKDALERALPRLVCEGRIDLATAQREIATNWIDAYKKYLGSSQPIHTYAKLLLPTEPTPDW